MQGISITPRVAEQVAGECLGFDRHLDEAAARPLEVVAWHPAMLVGSGPAAPSRTGNREI